MVSIGIDIVLAAIVGFCGWRGFRTGIINGVSWIIALIIALYGANLVSTAYYTELSDMVQPFAVGVIENTMSGDSENGGDEDDPIIDKEMSLEDRDKLDVYTVCMAVLTKLGLASDASESIARATAANHPRVTSAMAAELTERICDRAAFVTVFAIAFTLIAIVFTVIGNIFDLSFGLPGHENLNHITGMALGVIRGLMILLVIGCFARYVGILIPNGVMEGTHILSRIVETNRLAALLNI